MWIDITAGLALGGLEQAVESLQEAIGLAGLGPCNDAVEMLADHARGLLHWLDLGSHNVRAPLLEHCGNDVDLLALEDVAQMLAIQPGTGSAFGRDVGDQRIEIGKLCGGQATTAPVLFARDPQPTSTCHARVSLRRPIIIFCGNEAPSPARTN